MDTEQMRLKGKQLRAQMIRMLSKAGSGHPGGSLSAMDLLVVLYYRQMRNLDPADPRASGRDRFILSKGHACPALYAVLADKGFFPAEELDTLRQYGSRLQGHLDRNKTPGVDASAGSLGQGLSLGVGMALGARLSGSGVRVYVMMGDGEIQEGQTWEAAMSAAHYGLDNLTLIIDKNGLQIMGSSDAVMGLGNLEEKYRAFGFEVISIDGHNYDEIIRAFDTPVSGRPKCIIAHTVKGKGVSYMENRAEWHGGAPRGEQLAQALKELR
jgi:transketolase